MQFIEDTSFKFIVKAYNHTISQARQREVINSFSYMALLGKIDMKHPDLILGCFEECATYDSRV
jgi:tRNA (guanine10-N2)-methyltransferase